MQKQVKLFLLWAFAIVGWLPAIALSKTITLVDTSGQSADFYVDQADKFNDVLEWIQQYYQASQEDPADFGDSLSVSSLNPELALTLVVTNKEVTIRKKGGTKNYHSPVSSQEKKDIAYIVTSLAKESLISLAGMKSSLKRAGERIENVHPLRFLMAIFTDEELKAGIHAIRGRGSWVWDEFINGLIDSLKEETAKQNMRVEFIQDFANQVKINVAFIMPSIQSGKWKEFVNVLIDTIPRANDPNRYNM